MWSEYQRGCTIFGVVRLIYTERKRETERAQERKRKGYSSTINIAPSCSRASPTLSYQGENRIVRVRSSAFQFHFLFYELKLACQPFNICPFTKFIRDFQFQSEFYIIISRFFTNVCFKMYMHHHFNKLLTFIKI